MNTALCACRFEVELQLRFLKPKASDVRNLVTVPQVKLIRKLGVLDKVDMATIEKQANSIISNKAVITQLKTFICYRAQSKEQKPE